MRERVLAEVADASPRILVGPGPAPAGVRLTREVPPGGGPVAAIAAGLAMLDADVPAVALLAGDLPLLTRSAVGELLRRLDDLPADELLRRLDEPPAGELGMVDGVCFVDGAGRRQTLCGVWRPAALRTALHQLAARRGGECGGERCGGEVAPRRRGELAVGQGRQPVGQGRQPVGQGRQPIGRGRQPADPQVAGPVDAQVAGPVDPLGPGLAGASLRELLAGLVVREVTWSGGGPPPWFDCDTERDVRRAEEWLR